MIMITNLCLHVNVCTSLYLPTCRAGSRASNRGGARLNTCVQSAREVFGHAPFAKPHPLNCRESRQQTRKRGEVSETRVFVPTDRFINQIL